MKKETESHHPPQKPDCPRTRLAQGALAAVDVCRCGMLQVHIGALTLRMEPSALSELLSTFGQAVAAHSALRFSEDRRIATSTMLPYERGEA